MFGMLISLASRVERSVARELYLLSVNFKFPQAVKPGARLYPSLKAGKSGARSTL